MLKLPPSARPSRSNRTPPFLLVGVFVVSFFIIMYYWYLTSQLNAAAQRYEELEEKFHTFIDNHNNLRHELKSVKNQKQAAEVRNSEQDSEIERLNEENRKIESTLRDKLNEFKEISRKVNEIEQKLQECEAQRANLTHWLTSTTTTRSSPVVLESKTSVT